MELKKIVAKEIAARVKDGQCLGLGTGSTAEEIIRAIGLRVQQESLALTAVSSSIVSTRIAMEVGIKVLTLSKGVNLDWGFDGADEVSPEGHLLKGKGGALLKEKILANNLPEWIIAVTEDKLVKRIGEKCLLPVEVIPEAALSVEKELVELGATKVISRTGSNFYGPLFTESGNFLFDVAFTKIDSELTQKIKLITGVVEHGFFPANNTIKVLIASETGQLNWKTI